MIMLTLPEAFGTNSLTSIFVTKVLENCPNNREGIAEALKQKFVINLGFRRWEQLIFIAEETKKFVKWAHQEYGVYVDLTFV